MRAALISDSNRIHKRFRCLLDAIKFIQPAPVFVWFPAVHGVHLDTAVVELSAFEASPVVIGGTFSFIEVGSECAFSVPYSYHKSRRNLFFAGYGVYSLEEGEVCTQGRFCIVITNLSVNSLYAVWVLSESGDDRDE